MDRHRFRNRRNREPLTTRTLAPCEYCREAPWAHRWAIELSRPAEGRNIAHLCSTCRDKAAHGEISAGELRLEAHEREDRLLRECMGHAAYAREAGAMRQIR